MSEPRIFGPYTLIRKLAVGGMAEIHVAKVRGLGGFEKLIALKLVHPHLSADPHFVRMLIEEAKTVSLLAHANIAQVFDLGCIDDTHYIAMEYVDGLDVHGLSSTAGAVDERLPIAASCHIVAEMLNGLDHAHRKRDGSGRPLNLVHRDISPQNVMVSQAGEVKLVDFGIAKTSLQSEGTEVGVIKGKYYYMSPEQAWGDPTDRRSDVFSAGLMLHEMLTGRMVYRGNSIPQLIARVREAEIDDPRVLREEVPEQLARVVMTALARDPKGRFQSAIDMGEALRDVQYVSHPSYSGSKLSDYVIRLIEIRARFATEKPDAPPARSVADAGEILEEFGDPTVTRRGSLPERARPRLKPSTPAPRPMSIAPDATRPLSRAALSAQMSTQPAANFSEPPTTRLPVAWPNVEPHEPEEPTHAWSVLSAGGRGRVLAWPEVPSAFDESAPTARHASLTPRKAESVLESRPRFPRGEGITTPALMPPPSGDVVIETIPPTPPLPDFRDHGQRRVWFAWVVGLSAVVVLSSLFPWWVSDHYSSATLEIVSAPAGAEVRLDGKLQPNRTPIELRGLIPSREYHVGVEAPGFQPWNGAMRVERGSVRQIVVLKPVVGRVLVRSTPADAEVFLNGAPMGRSPLALENLTVTQTVRLTVRKAGFRDARRDIQLSASKRAAEIDVQLVPTDASQ
jgi:serine/threonine protein kinase